MTDEQFANLVKDSDIIKDYPIIKQKNKNEKLLCNILFLLWIYFSHDNIISHLTVSKSLKSYHKCIKYYHKTLKNY